MATSLAYNYTQTRDGIITRALRIIGALGQGEVADALSLLEAAMALNDLTKEWNADGMPLWAITNWTAHLVSGQANYNIPGTGVDVNVAPLKVTNAYIHNSQSNSDSPLLVITRDEYEMLGDKTSSGSPNQVWYDPPGNIGPGTAIGKLKVFSVPDANSALYETIVLTGQKPFQNFNAAADIPDFPVYFHNALVWGLADQLAYEYGVNFAARSMITKKAGIHKELALSFGTEEGSFRVQPMPDWNSSDG